MSIIDDECSTLMQYRFDVMIVFLNDISEWVRTLSLPADYRTFPALHELNMIERDKLDSQWLVRVLGASRRYGCGYADFDRETTGDAAVVVTEIAKRWSDRLLPIYRDMDRRANGTIQTLGVPCDSFNFLTAMFIDNVLNVKVNYDAWALATPPTTRPASIVIAETDIPILNACRHWPSVILTQRTFWQIDGDLTATLRQTLANIIGDSGRVDCIIERAERMNNTVFPVGSIRCWGLGSDGNARNSVLVLSTELN